MTNLQIIRMKVIENNANIAEIESRLNKHPYLSKNTLPGYPDAMVFSILESSKSYPDRKINPNFYHWYIIMKQFSPSTIRKWIMDQLYHDSEDSLINEFVKVFLPKKDTSIESQQATSAEGPACKLQNSQQNQLIIEYTLKDITAQKMSELKKFLDEYKLRAQIIEQESPKSFKLVCEIDPTKMDDFDKQISSIIQYESYFKKKKDMKGQKTVCPTIPIQERNK